MRHFDLLRERHLSPGPVSPAQGARRGPKKAIVAVAASILTAVYVILGRGVDYVDLTAEHFVRTDRTKVARRLLRRLGDLGYDVSTVRAPEAAA